MRPPLDNWKQLRRGYTFGEPTSYSDFHLGLDLIVPEGTPIYAPEAGNVVWTGRGQQMGLTIYFRLKSGPLVRFGHLSQILQTGGQASEGEVLGKSGNTGSLSSGPHLHVDVWRKDIDLTNPSFSKLIDPDLFFTPTTMNRDQIITRIFNNAVVNGQVRVIFCASGDDAGKKVGLLLRDGTLRVAQKGKTAYETLNNKFQVLNAALAHPVTSAEWSALGEKEGAPIQ